MQQSTGTGSQWCLFLCADRIEAAFGFASTAINAISSDFIVIFSSGVDDRFGRTDTLACAAKLTFIRVDFMHFFPPGNDNRRTHFIPKKFPPSSGDVNKNVKMTPVGGWKAASTPSAAGAFRHCSKKRRGWYFKPKYRYCYPLRAKERVRTTICSKYQANRLSTRLSAEKRGLRA